MSEVIKIENHVEQALERRLEQYVGKVNLQKFIEIETEEFQELEQLFFDLRDKRLNINDAEGVQLDNLGAMVGQKDRLGFDDDFYRILIQARIGINVSNGEPERIINTLKLLTKAGYVHYMNLKNAEIAVGSDGVINPLSVEFLISNLQKVVVGGVRVNYLAIYSPTEAFAFDGPNQKTIGKGFGSLSDSTVGGKLATLYTIKNKFSFAGNNTSDGGYGSIHDPLVGGVLISVNN